MTLPQKLFTGVNDTDNKLYKTVLAKTAAYT